MKKKVALEKVCVIVLMLMKTRMPETPNGVEEVVRGGLNRALPE